MLSIKSELSLRDRLCVNSRIEKESYNSVFYNPKPGLQSNRFQGPNS